MAEVEGYAVTPGTEDLGMDMTLLKPRDMGRQDLSREALTLLPRQG